MEVCRVLAGLLLLACLSGCTARPEEITKQSVTSSSALTTEIREFLYITDRAPVTSPSRSLSYGAERAIFLSFGSVSIAPMHNSPGNKDDFRVSAVSEAGRFPATPYGVVATENGLRRTPEAVAAHEQASVSLQAEVGRRLAAASRKEVVVFIHGYNNSFDDAALSTGEICRSLRNEFVCVVLTWPAGGTRGSFFGYNIDRESSEFAVADFKKAIRIIAETKGVERLHLLAHSRGTDVLANVIQQLAIEAYVSGSSLWQRYKVANAVFFAPDIDLDVASSKLFAWVSDPDLAFGRKSSPSSLPSQGSMHLTIYSSPRDGALKASTLLFGSALRLGQLSVGGLPSDRSDAAAKWAGSHMGGLVDFIEYAGRSGIIGHSYFLSDANVRADLAAVIRDRAKAGDPRRGLVEIERPFWLLSDDRQSARR